VISYPLCRFFKQGQTTQESKSFMYITKGWTVVLMSGCQLRGWTLKVKRQQFIAKIVSLLTMISLIKLIARLLGNFPLY